jgi:hypothetical protein
MVVDAPRTEGVKYAGSKLKLLPYILQLARKIRPESVLDGFSGTTRVSQAFAQHGCRVLANDLSAWSKTFGKCYLMNEHPASHYQPIIDHLNALPGQDGWFTENYGGRVWGRISTCHIQTIPATVRASRGNASIVASQGRLWLRRVGFEHLTFQNSCPIKKRERSTGFSTRPSRLTGWKTSAPFVQTGSEQDFHARFISP